MLPLLAGAAAGAPAGTPAGTPAGASTGGSAEASAAASAAAGASAGGRADEAGTIAAAAAQLGSPGPAKGTSSTAEAARGPNPYLALLPDPGVVDWAAWGARLRADGQDRAASRLPAATAPPPATAQAPVPVPVVVDEQEPDQLRGGNDDQRTAQLLPGVGTGVGERAAARILGTLGGPPTPRRIGSVAEDDGSIPLANRTGLTGRNVAVIATGAIGDGPHGSGGDGSGDVDFYAVDGVAAGQRLDVAAETPASALDTVVGLWSSDGTLLAMDDDGGTGLDSVLSVTAAVSGDYVVSVGGFRSAFPADPFDSGSGGGVGSEGSYDVTLGLDTVDPDHYALDVAEGDLIGATVSGSAAEIALYDLDRQRVIGSTLDFSAIYPASSPLPGGGNAVLSHVVDRAGRYALLVTDGVGDYDATVEVYRAGLAPVAGGPQQTLFLDFDGARLNTGIFGGPGVRTLSPLSAFLGRWGLGAGSRDAVIDAVVAAVTENVRRDLRARGRNPDLAVRILNSRDHADPFGWPNVSRVVIGGTIEESGVSTLGIAQSIDPGNTERAETALVLLDLLSSPGGESAPYSLNTYLRPGSARVAFVGRALGNLAAHEAGHILGNFHTENLSPAPNLMDQGGNFPPLFGVGPDGVGGTPDDSDVDFGEDIFAINEGLTGVEDTLTTTSFGLTGGTR